MQAEAQRISEEASHSASDEGAEGQCNPAAKHMLQLLDAFAFESLNGDQTVCAFFGSWR